MTASPTSTSIHFTPIRPSLRPASRGNKKLRPRSESPVRCAQNQRGEDFSFKRPSGSLRVPCAKGDRAHSTPCHPRYYRHFCHFNPPEIDGDFSDTFYCESSSVTGSTPPPSPALSQFSQPPSPVLSQLSPAGSQYSQPPSTQSQPSPVQSVDSMNSNTSLASLDFFCFRIEGIPVFPTGKCRPLPKCGMKHFEMDCMICFVDYIMPKEHTYCLSQEAKGKDRCDSATKCGRWHRGPGDLPKGHCPTGYFCNWCRFVGEHRPLSTIQCTKGKHEGNDKIFKLLGLTHQLKSLAEQTAACAEYIDHLRIHPELLDTAAVNNAIRDALYGKKPLFTTNFIRDVLGLIGWQMDGQME